MIEPFILLVEDTPADVKLTRRAIQKAGLQISLEVVSDGVEALEFLHGSATQPAKPLPTIVLLDLNLPRLDGHQVLERIRAHERTRRLPVIILTSSVEESDVARSYDAGVNSYLRKPVAFEAFVEAARHLGVYWMQLNRPPPAPENSP